MSQRFVKDGHRLQKTILTKWLGTGTICNTFKLYKMDIYIKSKIDGLEDHIKNQDKTIKGWIEVANAKDRIIEQYEKIIQDLNKH